MLHLDFGITSFGHNFHLCVRITFIIQGFFHKTGVVLGAGTFLLLPVLLQFLPGQLDPPPHLDGDGSVCTIGNQISGQGQDD